MKAIAMLFFLALTATAQSIPAAPDDIAGAVTSAKGYLDGTLAVQIREYHRNYITAMRFDPAGHWLASADSYGKLVLWDTLPFERIVEWSYSGGFPRAQRFAADGKRLAVTSQGGERLSVFDVDPAWWRRRALAVAGTQHEKQ